MRQQRGAAALVVAVVLLFGMTLTAFFVNRGMIFEQRTSANQYRSTKAFEMAEAGLEWAVARINDEAVVAASDSSCAVGVSTQTFADRYLPVDTGGFTGIRDGRPACSIAANGVVTCGCPATSASNAVLGRDADPRFMIQFAGGGDPWTIRITSRGCTNAGAFCDPASAATPDGMAVVTALYKMKPALPVGPGAGLVTGAATNVGGNLNVINLDPKSNGITINAGSVVNLDGSTSVVTLPGTPPRASVLDNDPSLRDLTNADVSGEKFFKSFMGEGFTEYQNNSKTHLITSGSCSGLLRCTSCASANACGQAISDAYTAGAEKFWADTDVSMRNANKPAATATNPDRTFGTATRPLVVASSAHIEMSGSIVAYGLFYAATSSATADLVDPGTGTATVFGAIVSRSRFTKGTGTLNLIYDPNLFAPGRLRGTMVRVPGSWRDSTGEL